jgi:hypothetical protein
VEAEFIGLVNYSILALVQLETDNEVPLELSLQEAVSLYDRQVEENLRLLQNKNHDYGEAWRQMRISSMTDLILQKLLRIKQIEDNSGATLVSEGGSRQLPRHYQLRRILSDQDGRGQAKGQLKTALQYDVTFIATHSVRHCWRCAHRSDGLGENA